MKVWNLDIVIAMVLEAIVAVKAPAPAAVLGGIITLGGACLAMQSNIAGGLVACAQVGGWAMVGDKRILHEQSSTKVDYPTKVDILLDT